MERAHQCATIQLDFQLPIRFRLKYQCKRDMAPGAEGEEPAEAAKEVMEQEAEAPAGAEGDDKRTWRRVVACCWCLSVWAGFAFGCGLLHTQHTHTTQHRQLTTWRGATNGPSSCTAPCWARWSA